MLALTVGLIGAVLAASALLMFHDRLSHEGKFDDKVLNTLRHERSLVVASFVFLSVAFVLSIIGELDLI